MKWLKRGALILLGVLLLAAATAWWLLGSNAGTRFALARAHSLTNGALTVEHANGHLLGPLDLTGIRYDDGRGTRVTIGKVSKRTRSSRVNAFTASGLPDPVPA